MIFLMGFFKYYSHIKSDYWVKQHIKNYLTCELRIFLVNLGYNNESTLNLRTKSKIIEKYNEIGYGEMYESNKLLIPNEWINLDEDEINEIKKLITIEKINTKFND